MCDKLLANTVIENYHIEVAEGDSEMADVTSELMYEILKQIQADTSSLKLGQAELKAEMQAMRGHLIAMQQDIHNIYASIGRLDMRVDRIERRLELVEPAKA